jgi:uncharacterized pyridoxamine 5'-phosphate oxidase family protein
MTDSWVVVSGSVVIESCLFVEFFAVEEVGCVPVVVALFEEDFSEGDVFDVLDELSVEVSDVAGTA